MELTLLFRAVGACAAAALGLWIGRRHRPADYAGPFGDLMGAVLAGLGAGRLVYLLGEGVDLWAQPTDVLMIRGGITPEAAAAAFLGYLAWTCRADRFARMDYLAPAVLWGLAAWEAGCWWQGSCLGSPSGLWWAMSLPGSDLTRHPVGLYGAVLILIGALGLGRWKLSYRGVTTWMALGWVSAARLIVPLWAVQKWSYRIGWYLVGLVVGTAGAVLAARRSERGQDDPKRTGVPF